MRWMVWLALAGLSLGCSSESDPGTGPDGADAAPTADGAAGSDGATGDPDAATGGKIIFVTGGTHSGDFGGLAGADSLCATTASSAGLGGTFKAWLSGPGDSAADRMSQGGGAYLRTDGTEVAASFDDLVDGAIEVPINRDENGDPVGGPTDVWTGTLSDGSLAAAHCGGFADSGASGLCGSSADSDDRWTDNITPPCSTTLHLYCVEQ